jgi:ATP-dependent Clp protease ATP-binding subunit ClpA
MAARKYQHQTITVQHLLLYMLESKSLVEHLERHGVVVDRLRKALAEAVVDTETGDGADPQPDATFQKVIQTAILRVQSKGRKEVSVLDVLGVLLDPNYRSLAGELIEECGDDDSIARLRADAV